MGIMNGPEGRVNTSLACMVMYFGMCQLVSGTECVNIPLYTLEVTLDTRFSRQLVALVMTTTLCYIIHTYVHPIQIQPIHNPDICSPNHPYSILKHNHTTTAQNCCRLTSFRAIRVRRTSKKNMWSTPYTGFNVKTSAYIHYVMYALFIHTMM